jgi:hypothetical protein
LAWLENHVFIFQALCIKLSPGENNADQFQRSPMRISQAIIEFKTRLCKDESLRKIV